MISNAFKGAYTNEVSQKNTTMSNAASGVKAIAKVALAALGFTGGGGLSGGLKTIAKAGGIGGGSMQAVVDEKKTAAATKEEAQKLFTSEEVASTIESQLGDNPINRSAKKKLNTVFETLRMAKEEKIINKKGQIETNLGNVDPNSEFGKQILEGLKEPKKKTENLKTDSDNSITISAKELEKYTPKGYFKEDKDTIEDRVKRRYGTTYDWREAGYLLADGTAIDLSGKNQGGPSGKRNADHRDVFEVEDYESEDKDGGTESMVEFMKRGNIRVMPEYPGINLQKEPTEQQYRQIKALIDKLGWKNGYFSIDFDNEKGDTIGSLSYEDKIMSSRIVEDIKEYFKTGKLPEQEDDL